MSTVMIGLQFRAQTCCFAECGVTFALTVQHDNELRDSHRAFYCPNGHRQWYSQKSEAEKLRDQLEVSKRREQWANDRAESQRQQAERNARRAAAARGQVTKIKRRVAKGVCPCCNRTFADVARHMESQHPDFANGDE
jgi:hypothetical protein